MIRPLYVEKPLPRDAGNDNAQQVRSVRVNLAESPLGWLKARGRVSDRQFDAGEALRRDYERAGLGSRVTMRWQAALGGNFARIDYRIVTKSDNGKEQVFEGIGFYRPRDGGAYDGTWFDSQGAMHPLKATFTGESLTAYWGVKGKTYGRTVYKLVNAYDQVEVVDAIRDKKGNWKEFSRNTLKKTE